MSGCLAPSHFQPLASSHLPAPCDHLQLEPRPPCQEHKGDEAGEARETNQTARQCLSFPASTIPGRIIQPCADSSGTSTATGAAPQTLPFHHHHSSSVSATTSLLLPKLCHSITTTAPQPLPFHRHHCCSPISAIPSPPLLTAALLPGHLLTCQMVPPVPQYSKDITAKARPRSELHFFETAV